MGLWSVGWRPGAESAWRRHCQGPSVSNWCGEFPNGISLFMLER